MRSLLPTLALFLFVSACVIETSPSSECVGRDPRQWRELEGECMPCGPGTDVECNCGQEGNPCSPPYDQPLMSDAAVVNDSATARDGGPDAEVPDAQVDAGERDAGDSGSPTDGGRDADTPSCGSCSDEAPVCGAGGQCVECLPGDESVCTRRGDVCLADGSSCVQCNENDDCGTGVCTAENSCTPCEGDWDCSGALNFCEDSRCVACRSDGQCPDGVCEGNVCVACAGGAGRDAQCTGAGLLCDATSNACVECLGKGDCDATAPVCSALNACAGCSASSDCGDYPDTPACDASGSGSCVECVPSVDEAKCGDTTYCSPLLTCEECVTDEHCDAAAPVCSDDFDCGGCSTAADCDSYPDTPACNVDGGGACVECVPGSDAAKCAAAGEVCLTGGTVCVECNTDSDCGSPAAAKCNPTTNQCEPCDADPQCGGITGTEACNVDSGQCVQCTATNREACGDDICASRSVAELGIVKNECATGVEPGTAPTCVSCLADAHCSEDSLCMPMQFENTPGAFTDVGWFCLEKKGDNVCLTDRRPYSSTINLVGDPVPSIDNAVEAVCSLAATTCPAIADYRDVGAPCADANDDDACGVEGLDDGLCEESASNPGLHLCTVPCLSDQDCPPVVGVECTNNFICNVP